MTHSLEATFDGEVFRPATAVDLAPNTHVQLTVTVTPPQARTPNQSFFAVAKSLKLSGPADWSSRLDDYLYGDESARRATIAAMTPSDEDLEAAASPPPAEWYQEDWSK